MPMLEARKFSNLASSAGKDNEKAAESTSAAAGKMNCGGDGKAIVSYWGVVPPQFSKEDGSPWRWNCFRVCLKLYNQLFFLSFFIQHFCFQ